MEATVPIDHASWWPFRKGEATTALLLAINVFVLLTCYYVLKVVREPLILLGGGAELKAYASGGQTVLLVAVVPAFGWLASRVGRLRLLTIVQSCFIACLIAFYALARLHAPIGLAFYLWLGIFNVMVIANFWSYANDLYTPEQGKRLFAIIALGGSAGAILGALIPALLHRSVGTYGLMIVAAVLLAMSTAIYHLVDRRERVDQRPALPVGREGGFSLVIHDRYLGWMAAMVLIATVVNATGEYVVGKMATEAARHEAAPSDYIRGFYASYYGLVNLGSAMVQLLLVSRVMARLGIRRALYIMPVIVIAGWLAFFAVTSVSAIRLAKTSENSVDYSLQNTLRHALFLPTSREGKYKAKAAIDTFFFRVGDAIAGLGIVYLVVDVLDLGVRAFAALNIALGLVWLVIARRTGQLHDQRSAERASRAALGLRETAP